MSRANHEYRWCPRCRSELTRRQAEAEGLTEDEIRAYYEMLPRKLMVSYMVFDYEKDAIEARALVAGGEDWQTIARRYNAGAPGRNDNFTMQIYYGTVADDFEREVFSLPVGAISEPIETSFGVHLVRFDGRAGRHEFVARGDDPDRRRAADADPGQSGGVDDRDVHRRDALARCQQCRTLLVVGSPRMDELAGLGHVAVLERRNSTG